MTATAPTGQEAQPQAISAEDVARMIHKRAGVVPTSRLTRVYWFPSPAAPLLPTEFAWNEPCPVGKKGRTVFEMFEDDVEIRVYAVGAGPAVLMRLSKSASNFTIRELSPQDFINEVADEWSQFYDSMSTAEKERDLILDYGRSLPATYSLGEFLHDVQEEVHLEGIDENEEEEEEEAPESEEPEASTVPATPVAMGSGSAAVPTKVG